MWRRRAAAPSDEETTPSAAYVTFEAEFHGFSSSADTRLRDADDLHVEGSVLRGGGLSAAQAAESLLSEELSVFVLLSRTEQY